MRFVKFYLFVDHQAAFSVDESGEKQCRLGWNRVRLRHLSARGYVVASIEGWKDDCEPPMKQQMRIVVAALKRALSRHNATPPLSQAALA